MDHTQLTKTLDRLTALNKRVKIAAPDAIPGELVILRLEMTAVIQHLRQEALELGPELSAWRPLAERLADFCEKLILPILDRQIGKGH